MILVIPLLIRLVVSQPVSGVQPAFYNSVLELLRYHLFIGTLSWSTYIRKAAEIAPTDVLSAEPGCIHLFHQREM